MQIFSEGHGRSAVVEKVQSMVAEFSQSQCSLYIKLVVNNNPNCLKTHYRTLLTGEYTGGTDLLVDIWVEKKKRGKRRDKGSRKREMNSYIWIKHAVHAAYKHVGDAFYMRN